MNERVKELVKLSMKPKWVTNSYNGAPEYSGDEIDVQKFAELIVEECMGICDEVQTQYGQYTFTATTCKNRFKEHFGVRE